ncbi:coil containing protein [Vibrio phage 466E53-1]|nr:coil containing protein [Vibrio phage 466E53-1]
MTIEQYEMRFMTELEDGWQPSLNWNEWVKNSYAQFMDSVAEQEVEMMERML